MIKRSVALFCLLAFPSFANANDIKIITWNVKPSFYEGLPLRANDFRQLVSDHNPDILVLIEVTGDVELKRIANYLGWKHYYGIASNQSIARTSAFEALETAVISKIPIKNVIEYDVLPDGHHEVFTEDGEKTGHISERQLTADGISGFGQTLANYDRGTMRVDIGDELSIYPVHLKSNRNNECFDLSDATRFFKKQGLNYDKAADIALTKGFDKATQRRISNAQKRERVIAAVSRVASDSIKEGRVTIIAGDYNTAFEKGKYGQKVEDCELQNFSCAKAPFPENACSGADGFDDTLGMLETGIIADQQWTFLSRDFGRTYKDNKFADAAIDHIAVDKQSSMRFSNSFVADKTYGSDHFPIVTTFSATP